MENVDSAIKKIAISQLRIKDIDSEIEKLRNKANVLKKEGKDLESFCMEAARTFSNEILKDKQVSIVQINGSGIGTKELLVRISKNYENEGGKYFDFFVTNMKNICQIK